MKKYLLLSLLAFVLTHANGQQKNIIERPRLIVSIAVDGLRSDYLSLLWNELDRAGFKRLIENGSYCTNMSYPYLCVGNVADYASVYTGTIPSDHGICGETYWEPDTRTERSFLFDKEVAGVGGNDQISPRNLQTSTFVDELKLNTQGKAKVITIGINAEEASVMAGHGGNSTLWLDNESGLWASSTYFSKTLPSWANRMNGNNPAASYLRTNWSNHYVSGQYKSKSAQSRGSSLFAYPMTESFSRSNPIKRLKESPYINTMVKDLALDAIRGEYIGLDDVPDVVNLQFTVRGFNQSSTGILTSEIEDMYYRLDKDLRQMMDDIDALIGAKNVLYMVYAPQKEYTTPEFLKNYNIPTGYFVSDRSLALLNTYLMATYGQGNFVQGYANRQIFLNKVAIEAKQLDVNEVEEKVAEFMVRFQGVQYAFRTQDILKTGYRNERMQMALNSYHPQHSGDIIIFLQPGWVDVPNETSKVGISSRVNNYAPFILSGWKIKNQKIARPFSVLDIAPTISNLLLTPYPNSSTGKALVDVE